MTIFISGLTEEEKKIVDDVMKRHVKSNKRVCFIHLQYQIQYMSGFKISVSIFCLRILSS